MRISEKFYIYRQRERHENTFLTLVKNTLLTYITDSANNPNSSDLGKKEFTHFFDAQGYLT